MKLMPGCVGEDDEQYLVKRAEEAVAANPEKSDRAIAQEIGVSDKTVAKARKRTADQSAVAKRTGKDGKKRMSPAAPKTWAATQPLYARPISAGLPKPDYRANANDGRQARQTRHGRSGGRRTECLA
jgi:hypothetical protein